MPATMTEVARNLGVSVTLVSRLLRNDPTLRISDDRRAQILKEAKRMGGVKRRRPGSAANRPRRAATRTGTVLMPINRLYSGEPGISELTNSEHTRQIERTLGKMDYHLHLSFFEPGQDFQFVRSIVMSGNRCDGLVLGSGMLDQSMAELLVEHRFPHVTSASDAEHLRVNMVRGHVADGFRQAVNHLRELGHSRIAFVGPRKSYRYPLFVAAMVTAGLDPDQSCEVPSIQPGMSQWTWRKDAREQFAQWWQARRDQGFTAAVCSNDRLAFGVLDFMQHAGLTPGRDLSVVGYDNIEQHGMEHPGEPVLTTIDNPFGRVGRRMAELLINQILHDQTEIVHERIPADLVVRQTTGPAPTAR